MVVHFVKFDFVSDLVLVRPSAMYCAWSDMAMIYAPTLSLIMYISGIVVDWF